MNDTDHKPLSEKIVNEIKKGAPQRPYVYFILKNIGFWSLAVLSAVVGGLAVSSIVFRVINLPRVFPPGAPLPAPIEFLDLMPILWVILFGAFCYFAYRGTRRTERGYKYGLSTIVLSVSFTTLVLGIIFYCVGTGFMLDRFAGRHVPFQKDLEVIQQMQWLKPEDGYLMGRMQHMTDSGIVILDPTDAEWNVTFDASIGAGKWNDLGKDERIGLRGKVLDKDDHRFFACDIRSLEFQGDPNKPRTPLDKTAVDADKTPVQADQSDCKGFPKQ